MAQQARIIGYQIIGTAVRRSGSWCRLFGSPHLRLADAMREIRLLEQRLGGLWSFSVRGIRKGENPADLLAGTPIPLPMDATPWKLYAVEAMPYAPPMNCTPRWFAAWGRTAAEARADLLRRWRASNRPSIRDIVELTPEQEQALEGLDIRTRAARLEAYARENRANWTEATAL